MIRTRNRVEVLDVPGGVAERAHVAAAGDVEAVRGAVDDLGAGALEPARCPALCTPDSRPTSFFGNFRSQTTGRLGSAHG